MEKGKKGMGALLICAVLVASALKGALFSVGNARDGKEQVEHDDGCHQTQPAPVVGQSPGDIGKPMQPFKKVVGMTRITPEACITIGSWVFGLLLEDFKLVLHPCGSRGFGGVLSIVSPVQRKFAIGQCTV